MYKVDGLQLRFTLLVLSLESICLAVSQLDKVVKNSDILLGKPWKPKWQKSATLPTNLSGEPRGDILPSMLLLDRQLVDSCA